MVTAKLCTGRKHREHRRANGGDRIHDGAGVRTGRDRPGATILGVPLERVEPPTALLECVVSGLVDGRWTLKHAGVEQHFGFTANDVVILLDRLKTGNGSRIECGALPPLREIGEKKIQRRQQQDVIGKIFMQRKPIAAPLVEIGEGPDINSCYRGEWVIDHDTPPVPGHYINSRLRSGRVDHARATGQKRRHFVAFASCTTLAHFAFSRSMSRAYSS